MFRVHMPIIRDARVHARHNSIGLIAGNLIPCHWVKCDASHGSFKVVWKLLWSTV